MPMFDYKCDKCKKVMEFSTNKSLPKAMHPPEDMICPECKEGKLEKLFSAKGQNVDIPGGYDYEYGKKAWRRNMTVEDQGKVLAGEKDPY